MLRVNLSIAIVAMTRNQTAVINGTTIEVHAPIYKRHIFLVIFPLFSLPFTYLMMTIMTATPLIYQARTVFSLHLPLTNGHPCNAVSLSRPKDDRFQAFTLQLLEKSLSKLYIYFLKDSKQFPSQYIH